MSRHFHSLEPLEARIAPALLVVGANLLGGSNPHTGESSANGNSVTLIKVGSGQAIAWYDGTHITEISIGANTSLDLTGDTGNIVANLTAAGRLTDSDNDPTNGDDGNVLLANNLTGLATHPLSGERGDLGNIITGGTVSNVNVVGSLRGIYAGDGAFRPESAVFSGVSVSSPVGMIVNPVDPHSAKSFTFLESAAQLTSGASIKGLSIAIADELQLFAGSGVPHAAGGSVSAVHIVSAIVDTGAIPSTPGYYILGGNGGAGTVGGAGGAVFNILEDNASSLVQIAGGKGGDASMGAGGAGGAVSSLDLQGSSASYTVHGGMGGKGKPGGVGGSLVHVNFAGQTPNSGIIVTGDFNRDGLDDVLVVDTTSGDMVLSDAQNGGAAFKPHVQYLDAKNNNQPVVKITGAGSTPSGAAALDVNGDGKLDIVVAYRNSNSVAVYLGNGTGNFYDSTAKTFPSTSIGLSYSPDRFTVGDFAGSAAEDLLVTESTVSTTTAHVLEGDGLGGFATVDGSLVLSGKVNALTTAHTSGGDVAFAGTSTGQLIGLLASNNTTTPLVSTNPGVASITGGIGALDASSAGDTLVAVGTTGHAVNLYTIGSRGALTSEGALDLHNEKGATLSAHFVSTAKNKADSLALLSMAGAGSDFGLYAPSSSSSGGGSGSGSGGTGTGTGTVAAAPYTFSTQVLNPNGLKTFTVAYDADPRSGTQTGFGFAALGASINQFTYSADVGAPTAYALPFAGKTVGVVSGDGGQGLGTAKGGAAGSISGINAVATDVSVTGGTGGGSDSGAAGAGGSIMNTGSFVGYGKEVVVPLLSADARLQIHGGGGGTQTSAGATASGGAGGALSGLTINLISGNLSVFSGNGGNGHGGAAGSGGAISNLTLFSFDGNLQVLTGLGGDATSGNVKAGDGGSISRLSYKLSLDPATEALENHYAVSINTSNGGAAPQGTAGAGGAISGVSLDLDGADRTFNDPTAQPPLTDAHVDSTVRVSLTSGIGGTGAIGGAGGMIGKLSSVSYFDQIYKSAVFLNYVVMNLTAGHGGDGTVGNGGAGGSVQLNGSKPLQGITGYDPDSAEYAAKTVPLIVTAGYGGQGAVKGGKGGGIAGVVEANAKVNDGTVLSGLQLGGATLVAGHGGNGGSSDGGAGGGITSSSLAAGLDGASLNQAAFLSITAGAGGNGAHGGLGGAVSGDTFGAADGMVFTNAAHNVASIQNALLIHAGRGGDGASMGGKGGDLSGLSLNSPELDLGANVSLFAGDGGAASTSSGLAGAGGNISGISQTKDLNSVISLLQAGHGGDALTGTAGAGGSINSVHVAGFLGSPISGATKLGAFDAKGNPQGIFAGAAGSGQISAAAGSVASVIARQISAIAATYDTVSHDFVAAAKVSGIHADVIGYDVNGNGTFDTKDGTGGTPSQHQPIDGFILAQAISGIVAIKAPFQFTA